jgi:hypothetical protein
MHWSAVNWILRAMRVTLAESFRDCISIQYKKFGFYEYLTGGWELTTWYRRGGKRETSPRNNWPDCIIQSLILHYLQFQKMELPTASIYWSITTGFVFLHWIFSVLCSKVKSKAIP